MPANERWILDAINDLRADMNLPPRIETDDWTSDAVWLIDLIRQLIIRLALLEDVIGGSDAN